MGDESESAATIERTLSALVGGRIDGAWFHRDTGLVAISVYMGERRIVGIGIGPRVGGIGWLSEPPRFRAESSQPLVAAMRAHLVDHRVRDVRIDEDGVLWIVAGGAEIAARIGFVPVRTGEARIIGATGNLVVRWPAGAEGLSDREWLTRAVDLAEHGRALAAQSDGYSFERARAQLAKAVQRRITHLVRRADAVRDDLARLENVPALQKTGRLLVAQGARIPRGAKRATLEDWEEGGTIEIELDPAIPAKQQAEALFAKARRIQRGEAAMRARLGDTERAIQSVSPLRERLAAMAANDERGVAAIEALEALARDARAAGVRDAAGAIARGGGGPAKSASGTKRVPFIAYTSAGGHEIRVGRGAKDNDALTTKHARPHDLWLHAKGVPGAHVVVPLAKGESCPPDVLVDAATLAVHHSDARGETVTEVSYVERRFVRKPRGAPPGKVALEREKVIVVRVEKARLERLLASIAG